MGRAEPPTRQPAPRPVAAIVLAAGSSRRMGTGNKLLEPVDSSGTPMCRLVVDRLAQAGLSPIIVVTGHQPAAVRAALAGAPVRFVHNPDHASGMGGSLATGARALSATAVLVALADMPDVSLADLHTLLAVSHDDGAAIVAPIVDGRRGHPVIFPPHLLPPLQQCSGDEGARRLLRARTAEVALVPMSSPGVVQDIDTPAQLTARRARGGEHAG